MYSSTLCLFAFKNCDTHSLQHTKQKKSFKMRESSPGECKVHYFEECFLYKCIQQKVLSTIQTDMQHICAFLKAFYLIAAVH